MKREATSRQYHFSCEAKTWCPACTESYLVLKPVEQISVSISQMLFAGSSLSLCLRLHSGDSEAQWSRLAASRCLWALHEGLSPEELIRSTEKEFNGSLPALGPVSSLSINCWPAALRKGAIIFAKKERESLLEEDGVSVSVSVWLSHISVFVYL